MNIKCRNPYYQKTTGLWFDCGQCLSCRKKRAREWTIRCLNELETHYGDAQFITLTYDQQHINKKYSLDHGDVQKMFKRLRKELPEGQKIKYFMCGEYGTKYGRPHYHMILYGLSHQQAKIFFDPHSPDDVWRQGWTEIAYLANKETIQYVAQYTLKKMGRKYYEETKRKPPYIVTSTGFGKAYAVSRRAGITTAGYIQYQQHKYAIPRYYFKVWNMDRAAYYKDYCEKSDLILVGQAISEKIVPFLPPSDHPNITPVNHDTQRERKYMQFGGELRPLTFQFEGWITGIRQQRDAQLKKSVNGIRENYA